MEKSKINILDTPGYNIFINDTRAALVAADAAIVLVDGVAGVEVQTEKVWGFASDFKLPRAVIINKLDRERAAFDRALESVQSNFGRAAVPIQIPIGAEREFKGVIDLVRMKAYTYTPDGDGKGKEGDIPANLAEAAQQAHEVLVEMVAEGNDALMEQFFDKGTLEIEQILAGLKQGVAEMRIFPVFCMSGLHNIGTDLLLGLHRGTDLLLDFIVDNLPSPTEREGVAATVRRQGNHAKDLRDGRPIGLRFHNYGRSVRRPHYLFQGDHRRL
ncbi:MAG: GTP-binding protein [Ignavibacteriota bacterium]